MADRLTDAEVRSINLDKRTGRLHYRHRGAAFYPTLSLEQLKDELLSRRDGHESTASIAQWASETFGDSGSDARVAARANEEMAELLRAVTSGQRPKVIREEAADVVIVLARLVFRNDGDLWKEVERKMAKNRAREWKLDGSGHGYHVREGRDSG